MGDKHSNGSSLQIPVIDIDMSEAGAAADTADQLVDAIARYGFVYVRGEGIGFTKSILDNAFAMVQTEQLPSRWTNDANNMDSRKDSSRPPWKRRKNAPFKPM